MPYTKKAARMMSSSSRSQYKSKETTVEAAPDPFWTTVRGKPVDAWLTYNAQSQWHLCTILRTDNKEKTCWVQPVLAPDRDPQLIKRKNHPMTPAFVHTTCSLSDMVESNKQRVRKMLLHWAEMHVMQEKMTFELEYDLGCDYDRIVGLTDEDDDSEQKDEFYEDFRKMRQKLTDMQQELFQLSSKYELRTQVRPISAKKRKLNENNNSNK